MGYCYAFYVDRSLLIMGGINSIARMFEIIFPITVFIF